MKRSLCLFVMLALTLTCVAQVEKTIISRLTNQGLENVGVIVSEKAVVITYENNLYRFQAKALDTVLHSIQMVDGMNQKQLHIIPQVNQVSIVNYTVNYSDILDFSSLAFGYC